VYQWFYRIQLRTCCLLSLFAAVCEMVALCGASALPRQQMFPLLSHDQTNFSQFPANVSLQFCLMTSLLYRSTHTEKLYVIQEILLTVWIRFSFMFPELQCWDMCVQIWVLYPIVSRISFC